MSDKKDPQFSPEISNNSKDRDDYAVVQEKGATHLHVLTFQYKGSLDDLKSTLERILARSGLDDFIVYEDTETENTLAILKDGDVEQFGIYICNHCGMIFGSMDEKIIHERIHYFM